MQFSMCRLSVIMVRVSQNRYTCLVWPVIAFFARSDVSTVSPDDQKGATSRCEQVTETTIRSVPPFDFAPPRAATRPVKRNSDPVARISWTPFFLLRAEKGVIPSKLETEALTWTVDGDAVIDGISLTVSGWEVLAIIGPFGAGKSPFLRLLNRLEEPTDETVFLDGTDYPEIDPQTLRKRIELIQQRSALQPGTVHENATLAFRIRDEPIDDDRIERLLSAVDLDGYADRDVENLSGGERQRVSIVRTLANEPAVLLLDEPTSSLDHDTEKRIETLLSRLIDECDLTCLLVTHDTDQARRLGNRLARFQDGEITRIGSPQEVIASSELRSNREEIEAVPSLGVPPERAVETHVSQSVYGALIPVLDKTKSLGIVAIPGTMAGTVIAGESPIYAAQYQFAVMVMLFSAARLTTMVSTYLISRYAFTEADQLDSTVLRAAES